MSTAAPSGSTKNPILWGAYLACSWTWCIGMFLPILLLRDMGWPGFWIFAIPNVVGAAAMGWVLTSRSASERFVERHAHAIWWFSAITLAFHCYWLLWIARFFMPVGLLLTALGVFLAFSWGFSRSADRGKSVYVAAALLALSLTVFVGTGYSVDLREATASLISSTEKTMDARWMLPVMLFGFLLCPYLDITFHHARQQLDSSKNGRLGFTIGFVGFFSFMIVLTTRYAGTVAAAMDGSETALVASPWLVVGLLLHLLGQAFFTLSAHRGRMRALPAAKSRTPAFIGLLVAAGILGFLAPSVPAHSGLSGGEIIYRLFMSAYGLVFPAYMLYRGLGRENAPRGRWVMWTAMAFAAPFYWMGFIEGQTIWLLPGLALIFIGTIFPKAER